MNKKFFSGFTLIELTLVASMVSALSVGTYLGVQKGKESQCLNNLNNIYKAIAMFEMDNGALPGAKFFPSSVSDTRGIHYMLAQYGARGVMFCPSLPEQLNNYGTNYIWNDELSGKNESSAPAGTWLMTEMTAVSKNIGSPHMGGFAVLFVGGSARISPRVEFPETSAPAPEPEKPELKKPDELSVSAPPVRAGLNFVIKKEIKAGDKVNIAVFMSDSAGKTVPLKPGTLSITCDPAGYAEIPASVEVKSVSSEVSFTAVFRKAGKITVKARDESTGADGALEVDVSAGAFNSFSFPGFPVLWEAGKPQKLRIVLLDLSGNRVDYNGESVICLSAVDTSPRKILVTNGVWEGELTLNTVSEGNLLYASGQGVVGVSPPFAVRHSSPSAVDIVSASEAVAGISYGITARVKDAYGNVCTDYEGAFDLDLPEGAVAGEKKIIILPENSGEKKNNLTFFKAGSVKIQVSNGEIKGAREVYVNPGGLTGFSIREIDGQEAGRPFDILVRAVDKWGNQVKGYYLRDTTGTVEYVNRDFTAGVWMETLVITQAGEHTVYIEDVSGHQGRSNPFIVKPSVPSKMEISGIPVSIVNGREYSGIVTVKDKFGNVLSAYTGELITEYPEDLKVSLSQPENTAVQVKVTAGRTGCFKLTVRDKKNKDLSAEQVLFVTEADE